MKSDSAHKRTYDISMTESIRLQFTGCDCSLIFFTCGRKYGYTCGCAVIRLSAVMGLYMVLRLCVYCCHSGYKGYSGYAPNMQYISKNTTRQNR